MSLLTQSSNNSQRPSTLLLLHPPPHHHTTTTTTDHRAMANSHSNPRRPSQLYPGLAAFSDAIEAVPQETIRHFTLLREVDAKASGPEDLLRSYIRHALPTTHSTNQLDPAARSLQDAHHHDQLGQGPFDPDGTPGGDVDDRQSRLRQIRVLISDLLLTLDEKIHVISTASEALAKHLARVDDAYDTAAHEIDATIRDGNPAHWAYGASITEELASQRPGEPGPGVSSRARELVSRRHLQVPDTSDPKLSNHPGSSTLSDLSIAAQDASPSLPAAKRRKGTSHNNPVKTSVSERPMATARGSGHPNLPIIQATASSGTGKPHGPQALPSSGGGPRSSAHKKRAFGPPPTTASSPVSQNFSDVRAPSTAAYADNSATATNESGGRGLATSHRNPRSKPQPTRPEVSKSALASEVNVKQEERSLPLELGSVPPSRFPQDRPAHEGNETVLEASKEADREQETSASHFGTPDHIVNVPPKEEKLQSSIPLAADKSNKSADAPDKATSRGGMNSITKASSKGIPLSEPSRNSQPTVRKTMSGKVSKSAKGSLNKEEGSEKITRGEDDTRNGDGEDEDEEAEGDPDEIRYCYCNQVSYGRMVACDGPGCQREWFHLPCVGLTHMPSSKDKWYCNECRINIQSAGKPNKPNQHKA
ncbi:hypothetical protein DRE_07212 [Drechslerella stenobrocha 248]|uniref:Chromatin modification-related protein n=1 Tax=Drechslerella stenobrocha 248 TaxID=1043628 RepID=W7HVK8_9PEZI|nr:hypothetical protein DRE_07212 [Drechslerella stenobrocha 248]